MCGIVGYLSCGKRCESSVIQKMTDALAHRGPDDRGVFVDEEAGVALGHRRLSVIDVTLEGHQPMASHSKRYIISYNGEVFNYQAIRSELEKEGVRYHGHSDTEVILSAIERWGLKAAILKFRGMFAFALWDRQSRTLVLVRDRLGIKPLYYGWTNGCFVFGSELKALRAHPSFENEIDRDAVALYLKHNYIPAPYSIYHGMRKLLPGHLCTIQYVDGGRYQEEVEEYWSLSDVAIYGRENQYYGDAKAAAEQLHKELMEAVGLRTLSDVPLGAFLSGGVDSSLVVALMQAQSSRPVKTFSIGFNEDAYNEAAHAQAVAMHLGTDHTELYVSHDEARDVIPLLPKIYDEPFADSSQIPTYLVSLLARKHVTVSLSGDGGDELFGGYNRYFWANRIWRNIGWVPEKVRNVFSRAMTSIEPGGWDAFFQAVRSAVPRSMRHPNFGNKVHKLAEVLGFKNPDALYDRLISHWNESESVVIGSSKNMERRNTVPLKSLGGSFVENMMCRDSMTYLPDDILVKVDRASMAVSLEARVPLLDHKLVEFAWTLPLSLKIRGNEGKWLLRQVLYKYVPQELIERPKMGFGVPIDSWLRGSLKDWADSLLSVKRLRQEGFFDPVPIRKKWDEHLAGTHRWQYHLWGVLMFQSWLEQQRLF